MIFLINRMINRKINHMINRMINVLINDIGTEACNEISAMPYHTYVRTGNCHNARIEISAIKACAFTDA